MNACSAFLLEDNNNVHISHIIYWKHIGNVQSISKEQAHIVTLRIHIHLYTLADTYIHSPTHPYTRTHSRMHIRNLISVQRWARDIGISAVREWDRQNSRRGFGGWGWVHILRELTKWKLYVALYKHMLELLTTTSKDTCWSDIAACK